MKKFFYPAWSNSIIVSWISLIMRVVFGLTMLSLHGWAKMLKAIEGDPTQFADPIGIGPSMSLYLTAFAEVICSAMLALGFFTRGVLVPLIITMLVAIFVVHLSDPISRKELAIIYTTAYVVIFIIGPGKFSIDHVLYGKSKTNV